MTAPIVLSEKADGDIREISASEAQSLGYSGQMHDSANTKGCESLRDTDEEGGCRSVFTDSN